MKKANELYRMADEASRTETSIRTAVRSKGEVATLGSLLGSLAAYDNDSRTRLLRFVIGHYGLYMGNN